jgi:hypothetical protein
MLCTAGSAARVDERRVAAPHRFRDAAFGAVDLPHDASRRLDAGTLGAADGAGVATVIRFRA